MCAPAWAPSFPNRRRHTAFAQILREHPCLDKPEITWDDPAWAIVMGTEHERIHIETSSVLIRELPLMVG